MIAFTIMFLKHIFVDILILGFNKKSLNALFSVIGSLASSGYKNKHSTRF